MSGTARKYQTAVFSTWHPTSERFAPTALSQSARNDTTSCTQRSGNLNRLLAWGHAKALETLLETVSCGHAIADQFGDERLILNALQEKGRTIVLEQRHKAESDLAVAAASILARAEFLLRLKRLSGEIGMTLPKGVSPAVELAGRMVVKKHGEDRLGSVAKLHFKTTQAVLGKIA